MPMHSLFSSVYPYIRKIRNGLIICGTLYVFALLAMALTGWGKVGSAYTAGPSSYEITRQMIHTKYIEGKKNTAPDALLRTETVAWVLCKTVGELCSDDLSAPADTTSFLHQAAGFIAMPFSQPAASGVAWLSDTLEHVGFVPKSYAQGMGFSALGSYRVVWKIMRDIAFLLITLMIVISGFIIIFGIQVGEKAGIAIEEMLPRLVIVLIVISLSYAIVGFMIDLMYVTMFLAFSMMAPILELDPLSYNQALVSIATGHPSSLWHLMSTQDLTAMSYIDTATGLFKLLPSAAQFVVSSIVTQIGLPALAGGISAMIPGSLKGGVAGPLTLGQTVTKPISRILDPMKSFLGSVAKSAPATAVANTVTSKEIVGGLEGSKTTGFSLALSIVLILMSSVEAFMTPFITPLLISMMLFITAIYLFFKVLFMLFNCYVEIVVATIFGPIFIMLHALPGSKSMYTWLKSLAINLLIFPAVLVLMMIAGFVSNANGHFGLADTSKNFWAPPFLNSLGSQTALQTVMGGLIFYNIPVFITQLKKSLGYEEGMFSSIGVASFAAPAIGFVTSSFGLVNATAGFAEKVNKSGLFDAARGK